MGSKNNTVKKDKEEIQFNIPKPFFKNRREFKYLRNPYQLNKYKNSLYYITISHSNIVINKYDYEANIKQPVTNITINENYYLGEIKIESYYFYSPLYKREYLVLQESCFNRLIYVIEKEKEYKLIDKIGDWKNFIEKPNYIYVSIYNLYLFDIIYNKYEQISYIITLYDYNNDYINYVEAEYYKLKIEILNKDNVKMIKLFEYPKSFSFIKNLIYKDKRSKTNYIVVVIDYTIKLIEIRNEYLKDDINFYTQNVVISESDNKLIDNIINDNSVIISTKSVEIIYSKDSDYLFINNNNKNKLIIINLTERKIFKNIELKLKINDILNWNNEFILFRDEYFFYVFDTKIFKIITKYCIDKNDNSSIYSMQCLHFRDKNIYGLLINGTNYFSIKKVNE